MRLGLIGTGRIGAFHAETLAGLTDIELVIADTHPEQAQLIADKVRARSAVNADALIASNLDGVVIAASTTAHAHLIGLAAEAGLPIFCEKPVAENVAETLSALERVEAAGVPLQVGFQRRFDRGIMAVREAVQNGKIGRLHLIRSGTGDPAPPPAGYLPNSGGIFHDCAIHDFDVVRWIAGREVVEVHAAGANKGDAMFAEADDVDTASATLTFDDGTIGIVWVTRYNGAGYDVRLEAVGSKSTFVAGLNDNSPLQPTEGVEWPAGSPYMGFMERFRDAYITELTAFIGVAKGETESPCTGRDAFEAQLIAEAADRSRREQRPVKLSEVRP